jgi:hypothetical protein
MSKAGDSADRWLSEAASVLGKQQSLSSPSNGARLFMHVDPAATDQELLEAARSALDRLFGPLDEDADEAWRSEPLPQLVDPYGGPDEPDPDIFGPDPEVGPDECNGPWDNWPVD